MNTERYVVEKLVALQYQCYDKMDLLEKAGVQYDIFGQHELLILAVEILGYPKDNTREFGDNFNVYNNGGENFDMNKRTDFINYCCLDYIDEKFFELQNDSNRVVLFTDWIFQDIGRLKNERPSFFVNKIKFLQN